MPNADFEARCRSSFEKQQFMGTLGESEGATRELSEARGRIDVPSDRESSQIGQEPDGLLGHGGSQ